MTSNYIGLAIHHERLTMIKLKQIKKQLIIEEFAKTSLPKNTILDGKINQPEQLSRAIKQLVQANKAKKNFTALALPSSEVINKRLRMPAYLSDTERAAEITANLDSYLPGMDERLYFDFIPIEKHDQEIELQLIAARAEQVETYLQLTKSAGLKVNKMDVDVYAIARSIRWMAKDFLPETLILLDMDVTVAQLILLKQGQVKSIYTIVVGAELVLLQQIKRGIQIFSANEPTLAIEKVFLTGYLPNIGELKTLLETQLALSVERFDLLQSVVLSAHLNSAELDVYACEWLVAFGLGLRGFADDRN